MWIEDEGIEDIKGEKDIVDTGRGIAGRKSFGRGDVELSMEEDCR